MVDFISGRLYASMGAVATIDPLIRDGRVRAFAQGDKVRAKGLERIHTIAEAGIPEFQATLFNGIFVPAGASKEVVDTLSRAVQEMYRDRDSSSLCVTPGLIP